ncbi:MAG: TrkA family potassium uptake protein [Cytophagales bacterium]|nr:TrkA family potassium uptake protein [Cytophagales bacterium]
MINEQLKESLKKIITPLISFLTLYIGLIYLLLYFEGQDDNSPFHNFWEGVWYSTVTITSVGYGDLVPVTPLGKGVGFVFVLSSIGLYTFFISKLTNYIGTINEDRKMGFGGTKFTNHTVIIGWDHYSKAVAEQLLEVGGKIAIVTTNRENIDLIYENFHHSKSVFVLFSEYDNYDLLRKANIEKSNIVFINNEDDTKKLVLLLNIKKEFPMLKFIVTLDNSDLKDTFKSAGVTYPLSKHDLSSKLLASYIFEPDVAEFGEELLSVARTDNDYDIKEYLVIDGNPYLNQWYDDAFFDLKKKYNTILIGVSKIYKETRTLIKNPEEPVKIEKGDYLLLICNGKYESKITDIFGIEEGIVHDLKK